MASAVVACCLRGTCIPAGVARFHVHHVCKFSLGARCLSTAQGFNSNRTTLDCVPKRYVYHGSIHPHNTCKNNSRTIPSSVQQGTVKRFQRTFSTDHILEEITSSSEASEVLNLTGHYRSRLTHVHVFQAFNHLWSLAKFYSNDSLEVFLRKLHEHPEFNALCVLAENKLSDADCKTLVDTLYSTLRLTPEIYHPLVRALRTEIYHRLETLETDSLSKLAVCLQHMGDRCSPMLSEVLRLFYKKLHTVGSIRELSAWMREVIHLVASSRRQFIFQKVSQVLSETDPNEVGDNSIRRIIHSMVKVRSVNQPLLNQCAQILLQMIDSVSIKELCIMRNMLGNLSYENEALDEAIRSTIIKKVPACQEPDELALAIECVSRSASADIKLMLTDKAESAVPNLPPIAISHMCAGLRAMGYRSQTPLVLGLVKKIKQQSSNLSVDSVGTVLSFLKRIDNLEPEVFTVLRDRLLSLLRDTISPSRMINIVSSLSQLPSLETLDQMIPERISAFMPQIHIAGINQLLQATSKIARKLDDSESVRKDFLKLKQDLFEIAQVSIDKTMSIYYLNNLVEIILQDGGHVLVLDAAMKQYSKILHRLSPQLAVDCARNLFKARYLQRDLMDEIAAMATRKINKITPMQILYILSPFCTLNYLPPNAPEFFQACIERCEPFLDSLPSGYLVDLTHILTFVHQFPETFIRRIFSLDFLTKLDEELAIIQDRSMMYRRKLMYLNRTVALECPELQVPWFHEQFCHDLLKKRHLTLDASLMSVQSALVEVLGGPQYLRSFVVSPYYYDISFECVLDSEGSPLACADYGSVLNRSGDKVAGKMLADLMQWGTQTKQLPHGAQRVAIDYMPSTLFCINSRHTLGMMALKKRHMELLGYRYVQIPHFVWSSPVLVEREEKMEYLRQLIFSPEKTHQEGTVTDESNVGEILTGQVGPKLPRDLGIQEEGLLEDEMVLKVLHTFDRVG